MSNEPIKQYAYNPHQHVKIWLSNNRDVFMNTENQIRLISMREKNPKDTINLIYDSSLLNPGATQKLFDFCKEHRINPVDANTFESSLISENEKKLYTSYRDEINHLKAGGNLAVASDIIRWISPVYALGTYTDFDVPVDTTNLADNINVTAPLLLNIGSLRTRGKEIIITNNDYIAIIDPDAAKKEIEEVQAGVIGVLNQYNNDFIEKTVEAFGDSRINRYLITFMRNRSESVYIQRSKKDFSALKLSSSRELRKYINEIMTDQSKFLEFNKQKPTDDKETVIKRLRADLKSQLGLVKWLFFRNEYNEISQALDKNDEKLVSYLMKKERSLYLKSVVVCTTGPIAIAKFLFNGYVFKSDYFDKNIQHYSFNHYGLNTAFQSQNSIAMHENIIGMLNFLGAEDGTLNDSSWLEEGANLQQTRGELLEQKKLAFKEKLPRILEAYKNNMKQHIRKIESDLNGVFGFLFLKRKQAKISALSEVLGCFKSDELDISQLKIALANIQVNQPEAYMGFFGNQTRYLIKTLEAYCHQAVLFGLTKNRMVSLTTKDEVPVQQDRPLPTEGKHVPGLSIFAPQSSMNAQPAKNDTYSAEPKEPNPSPK